MHEMYDERFWDVASVKAAGCRRFKIVYGRDATAESDPVALAYRSGSIAHVGTLIRLARAVLKPGDRVLDLGAHLGGFALAAAAMGCEVIAVEGAPRNAVMLKRSVEINGFQNLHVVHAVVGDSTGAIEFSPHGPYGHVATSVTGLPTMSVPAVQVDDVLEHHGWDRVSFVKLDVEGSEVRAVRGASRLLSREDSPMVFFESNKHTLGFYDQSDTDLKAEFRSFGYNLYEARRKQLVPTAVADEQTEICVDYLAAKRLPRQLHAWTSEGLASKFRRLLPSFPRRAA